VSIVPPGLALVDFNAGKHGSQVEYIDRCGHEVLVESHGKITIYGALVVEDKALDYELVLIRQGQVQGGNGYPWSVALRLVEDSSALSNPDNWHRNSFEYRLALTPGSNRVISRVYDGPVQVTNADALRIEEFATGLFTSLASSK
jgi:hypothetical protein